MHVYFAVLIRLPQYLKTYPLYVFKQDRLILAVPNGVSVGLAYIVSQGNITATILWFTITTGVTAGLSYYKEKQ
jgi:hypothetical protein